MVETCPGPGDRPLGPTIRSRRRELGWTLDRLAGAVGCSTGYLSAVETGAKGPPTDAILAQIETALGFIAGTLVEIARWDRTPGPVRRELTSERARRQDAERALAKLLGRGGEGGAGLSALDEAYRSGELAKLLGPREGGARDNTRPTELPLEVPLINRVAAGYPAEFTDLGYPARVADDYVRCPDLRDPDAFAARVVGDSMEPDYREGDIVVFSPARDAASGQDCFVRIEPDSESTFKRVYFGEDAGGEGLVRLQPLNSRYPPRVLEREEVAGVYPAVTVMRAIG